MPKYSLPSHGPLQPKLQHLIGEIDTARAYEFTCRGARDRAFWDERFNRMLAVQSPGARMRLLGGFALGMIAEERHGLDFLGSVSLGLGHALMLLHDQNKFVSLSPQAFRVPEEHMASVMSDARDHTYLLRGQLRTGCPTYYDAMRQFEEHLAPGRNDPEMMWVGAIEAYRIVNQQQALELTGDVTRN
jgi:hypothetical protein